MKIVNVLVTKVPGDLENATLDKMVPFAAWSTSCEDGESLADIHKGMEALAWSQYQDELRYNETLSIYVQIG